MSLQVHLALADSAPEKTEQLVNMGRSMSLPFPARHIAEDSSLVIPSAVAKEAITTESNAELPVQSVVQNAAELDSLTPSSTSQTPSKALDSKLNARFALQALTNAISNDKTTLEEKSRLVKAIADVDLQRTNPAVLIFAGVTIDIIDAQGNKCAKTQLIPGCAIPSRSQTSTSTKSTPVPMKVAGVFPWISGSLS